MPSASCCYWCNCRIALDNLSNCCTPRNSTHRRHTSCACQVGGPSPNSTSRALLPKQLIQRRARFLLGVPSRGRALSHSPHCTYLVAQLPTAPIVPTTRLVAASTRLPTLGNFDNIRSAQKKCVQSLHRTVANHSSQHRASTSSTLKRTPECANHHRQRHMLPSQTGRYRKHGDRQRLQLGAKEDGDDVRKVRQASSCTCVECLGLRIRLSCR